METTLSPRELLKNYRDLICRVDELCAGIGEKFPEEIVCRAGCAGCCRHLTLLPIEAIALAVAMYELPPAEANMIRDRARKSAPDGPCPLLMDERCLLYVARPLICRTHGLPLLTRRDGAPHVDFCPENFRGVTNLPGSAVIDLERLNTALVAVDALFRREYFPEGRAGSDRYTIAEALLLQR